MRRVWTEDNRRQLSKFTPGLTIESFNFKDVSGLEDFEGKLDRNIFAICGLNGAGKSTLVEVLINLLSSSEDELDFYSGKHEGSSGFLSIRTEAEAEAEAGGEGRELWVSYSEGERRQFGDLNVNFVSIETGRDALSRQQYFGSQTNLNELLEGLGQIELSEEQLSHVSRVLQREYDSAELYDCSEVISDTNGEEGTYIYANACYRGVEYGAEAMGLGEYSVFLLLGLVWTAEPGSIICIEEPESFLSPHSQKALMDVLVYEVLQKDLRLCVTTHSPFVIEKLDRREIWLLVNSGAGIKFKLTQEDQQVSTSIAMLGLDREKHLQFLTEDVAAASFLRGLIGELADGASMGYEISHVDGGQGALTKIVSALMDAKVESVPQVFVFDGDMRGADEIKKVIKHSNVAFLPTQYDPSLVSKRIAQENTERLVEHLNCPEERLRVALGAAEGEDPHDWAGSVCRYLAGVTTDLLITECARIWVDLNRQSADLQKFKRELGEFIRIA